MSNASPETIFYKRARFKTNLPVDRLYSQAHYWLAPEEQGTVRVGLTKFATRMLGDFVELQFVVASGDTVEVGQPIGSIEGFKAISEIYCVAGGKFAGANLELNTEPTLLERQPYEGGWLYRIADATPDQLLDVHGYIGLLDATIDRMLLAEQEQRDKTC